MYVDALKFFAIGDFYLFIILFIYFSAKQKPRWAHCGCGRVHACELGVPACAQWRPKGEGPNVSLQLGDVWKVLLS